MTPRTPHVSVHGLVKIFTVAEREVVALSGLDLEVDQGEVVAIVGASGSGKSTLVDTLAGLQEPTAGSVRVGGVDLARMDSSQRARYRRDTVGFVWQQTGRNLLPYLDAQANIAMPLSLAGTSRRARRARADELLDLVGLADRARHRPAEMSGGEQQRVAIAVALAAGPELVLADEPTGELDTHTAGEVLGTLRNVSQSQRATVLIVTHDPLVSDSVERTVAIRDGRTSSEVLRRRAVDALGKEQLVEEEYAMVDRTGRVQLPGDYREQLRISNRVRMTLNPDHIGVFPQPAADTTPADAATESAEDSVEHTTPEPPLMTAQGSTQTSQDDVTAPDSDDVWRPPRRSDEEQS